MLVNGEPISLGPDFAAWRGQCSNFQWEQPAQSMRGYACNVIGDFSNQCYDANYYVRDPGIQYFCPPVNNVQCSVPLSNVCYPPKTVPHYTPALPCRLNEQWDYNSMCYNVGGEPCQFTNVVDLEDFMNNEKRKEKSRVAARCRRTKEMEIFNELTAALPAKKEEVEQLDKASVMRLAISYLRVRDVVSMLPADTDAPTLQSPKGLEEVQSELSYMKALDGFVLVLSQQGDFVYCSENIAEHLGVSQMEIMGQSVFEFSHPCDHDEIREALRASKVGRRDLLVRLKCTITAKGRNVHLKSASYKVIHLTGHMLTEKPDPNDTDMKDIHKNGALVAVGRPIPHPSNIEIPLDSKTFLTKHSLDMKFTYTDEGLMKTLGYEAGDLNGRSLYDYHHAADSASLAHQFKSLFSKGQCETGQYRFLAKSGGYAWVQTQATVITDKQQKPVSVVCVNYVISGIECKDEVFAAHQVQHADLKPVVIPKTTSVAITPSCVSEPSNGAIVAAILPEEERPIPVTELIFAPREKEMNKGYLTFSQNEGFTSEWNLKRDRLVLKDEPEDLTHLAPTAGDACIPLENSPFDMFDEFILNDNYCSLLGDDLANGSPVDSLIADSLLSSPERQENESTGEQSSLLTELSLDAYDSARSDNDIDDGNSPFIPINDDLPILEPAVMWGALPDNVRQARPQPSEPQTTAPALQRLLAAPPTGPPPQDLITNIYSDPGLIPSKSISSWDTGVKRVLKQDEEPCAKRVKRSPSPAAEPTQSSSSVLMNLLDMQRARQEKTTNYRFVLNPQLAAPNKNIPIPVINIIQATKQCDHAPIRSTDSSLMSPLSLNIGQNSLPCSPNYSPIGSPMTAQSTPQSLSPASSYIYSPGRMVSPTGVLQGYDPYLSNKMQASPGFPMQNEMFLDPNVSLTSNDFWPDTDVIQNTSDLLIAFDDVKLV